MQRNGNMDHWGTRKRSCRDGQAGVEHTVAARECEFYRREKVAIGAGEAKANDRGIEKTVSQIAREK